MEYRFGQPIAAGMRPGQNHEKNERKKRGFG